MRDWLVVYLIITNNVMLLNAYSYMHNTPHRLISIISKSNCIIEEQHTKENNTPKNEPSKLKFVLMNMNI